MFVCFFTPLTQGYLFFQLNFSSLIYYSAVRLVIKSRDTNKCLLQFMLELTGLCAVTPTIRPRFKCAGFLVVNVVSINPLNLPYIIVIINTEGIYSIHYYTSVDSFKTKPYHKTIRKIQSGMFFSKCLFPISHIWHGNCFHARFFFFKPIKSS